MDNCLDRYIYNALLKCSGTHVPDLDRCQGFSRIYPFTTENISGYINLFDLENKSLLTVGSSGDQVINASLFNCIDQTVIDICPFTKYYFYLKKAAIMSFTYKEYLDFFCYLDYPKYYNNNKFVFSKEKFNKLKDLLKILDYESFLFWNKLFEYHIPKKIRKQLFSHDEDRYIILKEANLYMKDSSYFEKAKLSIVDVNPQFICDDIMNVNLNRNYDNIFLSNLGVYFGINKLKDLIEKLFPYVNEKILLCYLYNTDEYTKYNEPWDEIYNLDKLKSILGNYITSFNTFRGIKGILFEDENYYRDSVIICDKNKTLSKKY